MALRLALLAAGLAVVMAGAPAAPAQSACPPGESNPDYCQVTLAPTMFVVGKVKLKLRRGRPPALDTGIVVDCPLDATTGCPTSVVVTANLGKLSKVYTLGRRSFRVRRAKQVRVIVPLTTRAARLALKKRPKIRLIIKLVSSTGRNGPKKTTRRKATIRLIPH